ncbi:MAG: hypothetical protein EOP06_10045, partial [Proteobacteria bacterium]
MIAILTALLFSISAIAAEKDFCWIEQEATVKKTFPMPNGVNFFIRSAPAMDLLSFASDQKNLTLDTRTGKQKQVPLFMDPIPTPDGKLMTIPGSYVFDPFLKKNVQMNEGLKPVYVITSEGVKSCEKDALCMTDTELTPAQVRASGKPFAFNAISFYSARTDYMQSIYDDADIPYNYQSLGTLRTAGDVTKYRMLFAATDSLSYRDYSYSEKSNKLVPVGPIQKVCGGLNAQLPSLSKNGREISAYDAETGTTNIYTIGENGKECQKSQVVPSMVGKADFSPDGKKLAFHVDQKAQPLRMLVHARSEDSLQVYVYDRQSKMAVPISHPKTDDNYFPAFLSNDRLAFISAKKDAAEESKFALKVVDLSQMRTPTCTDCAKPETKTGQMAALVGALQLTQCQADASLHYRNAVAAFNYVSPKNCQRLVSACDEACMTKTK